MATAVFCGDTVRASLECALHCDAETLMVFYGFIAGRGVFEHSEGGLFQSFFCWLWNCKMFRSPSL